MSDLNEPSADHYGWALDYAADHGQARSEAEHTAAVIATLCEARDEADRMRAAGDAIGAWWHVSNAIDAALALTPGHADLIAMHAAMKRTCADLDRGSSDG